MTYWDIWDWDWNYCIVYVYSVKGIVSVLGQCLPAWETDNDFLFLFYFISSDHLKIHMKTHDHQVTFLLFSSQNAPFAFSKGRNINWRRYMNARMTFWLLTLVNFEFRNHTNASSAIEDTILQLPLRPICKTTRRSLPCTVVLVQVLTDVFSVLELFQLEKNYRFVYCTLNFKRIYLFSQSLDLEM